MRKNASGNGRETLLEAGLTLISDHNDPQNVADDWETPEYVDRYYMTTRDNETGEVSEWASREGGVAGYALEHEGREYEFLCTISEGGNK